MRVSEALSNFLNRGSVLGSNPVVLPYTAGMEVQILCAPRDDVVQYNIRLNSEAQDKELLFDVGLASYIGFSGWDYIHKCSRYVFFDIDSAESHAHKKSLSSELTHELAKALASVPWLTVCRSTHGKGLHIYVHFDKPVTANTQSEHRKIAGRVRSLIHSELLQVSKGRWVFSDYVDCYGLIGWIWTRTPREHSFQLLSQGMPLVSLLSSSTVVDQSPVDQSPVDQSPVDQSPVDQSPVDCIQFLNSLSELKMSQSQKDLISWLRKYSLCFHYDEQSKRFHCHTCDLAEAHEYLNLKGCFKTASPGTDRRNANCFFFPESDLGWSVHRFGSTSEEKTWKTSAQGFAYCTLDQHLSFFDACSLLGEQCSEDLFTFRVASDAVQALKYMGVVVDVKSQYLTRLARLAKNSKGCVTITIDSVKGDTVYALPGFIKKRGVGFVAEQKIPQKIVSLDHIRFAVFDSKDIKSGSWYLQQTDRSWINLSISDIKTNLAALGLTLQESNVFISHCHSNPYTLVYKPFEPEELPGRQWNPYAPQFVVTPQEGHFPAWSALYKHLGSGLDQYVKANDFCARNNILDGSDYLQHWIAFAVRQSDVRLPCLFFWSWENNTGKSTFVNSLTYFVSDSAVSDIGFALNSNHNGELGSAMFLVISEINANLPGVIEKIKGFITEPYLTINEKHKPVRKIKNFSKLIHTANNPQYAPIGGRDKRVLSIQVPPIEGTTDDANPDTSFDRELKKQAPAFLHHILNLKLAPPFNRLGLPVFETASKRLVKALAQTPFENFLQEITAPSRRNPIEMGVIHLAYNIWLRAHELAQASYTDFDLLARQCIQVEEENALTVRFKVPNCLDVSTGLRADERCQSTLTAYWTVSGRTTNYVFNPYNMEHSKLLTYIGGTL